MGKKFHIQFTQSKQTILIGQVMKTFKKRQKRQNGMMEGAISNGLVGERF